MEYKETDVSQRSREVLRGLIESGEIKESSSHYSQIERLRFNADFREKFDRGEIQEDVFLRTMLRNNDPEYILLNTIVRLNLSERETRGLFERYLDNLFGPKSILDCERGTENEADILENGKIRVAKLYSKECDLLGIIPRDGFPDW